MPGNRRYHDADTAPSPWVIRFAPRIRAGGTVLDIACGTGRHTRYLLQRGYRVTAVDIDVSRIADLLDDPGLDIIAADLEDEPWPFAGTGFDGIVVTNYLHRPHFGLLPAALSPGGVLIFDTFTEGHEKYGRPSNPDFLLKTGELLAAFSGKLHTVAYELNDEPGTALRQRLCAIRDCAIRDSSGSN